MNRPPALSVIVPYYRKFREFERVLPLNRPFLGRADYEVVLVMDEPSEKDAVLRLVRQAQDIRWRVILNEEDHEWRVPAKAINVGLKHALGTYVLICSPESAFITDVPACMLHLVRQQPRSAVFGQVQFATFAELDASGGSVPETAARAGSVLRTGRAMLLKTEKMYYGSICLSREDMASIHGYDESLHEWGGDDDNLRIRLRRSGVRMIHADDVRILHLSFEPRASRWSGAEKSHAEIEKAFLPVAVKANPDGWGRDFSRIIHDWLQTGKESGKGA